MAMYCCLLLVRVALLVVSAINRKKGCWIAAVAYDAVGLVASLAVALYYNDTNLPGGKHMEECFSSFFASGAFGVLLYISLLLWAHLPKPTSDEK